MKSGLEGRNNGHLSFLVAGAGTVSMKSGLEGRNNAQVDGVALLDGWVSMKSGLEGRNNHVGLLKTPIRRSGLNEVRPRWPEQLT